MSTIIGIIAAIIVVSLAIRIVRFLFRLVQLTFRALVAFGRFIIAPFVGLYRFYERKFREVNAPLEFSDHGEHCYQGYSISDQSYDPPVMSDLKRLGLHINYG